ncbi:MAG: hypothetical protein ACK6DA_06545 [Candidatus Kapaibacterium sp.]
MSMAEAMKIQRQIDFVKKNMTACTNKDKLIAGLEDEKQKQLALVMDLAFTGSPAPAQTPAKKA